MTVCITFHFTNNEETYFEKVWSKLWIQIDGHFLVRL
jgi:hypothetical protein